MSPFFYFFLSLCIFLNCCNFACCNISCMCYSLTTMKKPYQKPSTATYEVFLSQGVLTESIVEVDAEVKVKAYKDGFDYLGSDGFEVGFE